MAPGRNDPCPCGSGRKYKKCCWDKDRQKLAVLLPPNAPDPRERVLSLPRPAPPDEGDGDFLGELAREADKTIPRNPHDRELDARWRDFEGRDYEGKIALFLQTLEEKQLMDQEMAFEMLNVLHCLAMERDQRDRFDGLVRALRDRLPDVYAADSPFYLQWLIANALAAGDRQAVGALARELPETEDRKVDTLFHTLDMLAYHGELPVLAEVIRTAWPRIRDSREIMPWGIDEFANLGSELEMYDCLEHRPSGAADDAELVKRLEFYFEVDVKRLREHVDYVTGAYARQWKLSDFTSGKLRKDNRRLLTFEFVGHLRRQEGIPYPKAAMARYELADYLAARDAGDLDDHELEENPASGLRNRKRRKARADRHPLCPDHETLDCHLAREVSIWNPKPYRAAALMEMIPSWLGFLESRGLIDADLRRLTLEELSDMPNAVLKVLAGFGFEPGPAEGIRRSWAFALV